MAMQASIRTRPLEGDQSVSLVFWTGRGELGAELVGPGLGGGPQAHGVDPAAGDDAAAVG